MDGFKNKLNQSLQFRLSFCMGLIIGLMALIAVIISYLNALHEAKEIQDVGLKQVASLIKAVPPELIKSKDLNAKSNIIIQTSAEQLSHKSVKNQLVLPDSLHNGLQSVTVNQQRYRVLKLRLTTGDSVTISQPTVLVKQAALSAAVSTALPLLLLLPILIAAACMLISRAFKPIVQLSQDTQQRSAQDLTPLATEAVPVEIKPLIVAINQLFGKVSQTIDAQKRFIADAAHELRTPLTALSLQSELLAKAAMSDAAHTRLDSLRQGIERTGALLEQLLTFAKAQHSPTPQAGDVSVIKTLHKVLEDLMPLAQAKQINIGIVNLDANSPHELDAMLAISQPDLICIIKNLLDNAIKYSPQHGQIDISISKDSTNLILAVEDNGCGIPAQEKQRVFDAFYRVLGHAAQGSGLGLSIVKSMLDKLGGRIELLDASSFSSGLKVKVHLPLAA